MNTGPIIGGTRDGEQFSAPDKHAQVPAIVALPQIAPSREPMPTSMVVDTEVLRWVAFYFTFPNQQRDVVTGFWVSLTPEASRFHEDAEFRLFILTKLAERYQETLKAHHRRVSNDPRDLS